MFPNIPVADCFFDLHYPYSLVLRVLVHIFVFAVRLTMTVRVSAAQ